MIERMAKSVWVRKLNSFFVNIIIKYEKSIWKKEDDWGDVIGKGINICCWFDRLNENKKRDRETEKRERTMN